jgi:hypothetical protein
MPGQSRKSTLHTAVCSWVLLCTVLYTKGPPYYTQSAAVVAATADLMPLAPQLSVHDSISIVMIV